MFEEENNPMEKNHLGVDNRLLVNDILAEKHMFGDCNLLIGDNFLGHEYLLAEVTSFVEENHLIQDDFLKNIFFW